MPHGKGYFMRILNSRSHPNRSTSRSTKKLNRNTSWRQAWTRNGIQDVLTYARLVQRQHTSASAKSLQGLNGQQKRFIKSNNHHKRPPYSIRTRRAIEPDPEANVPLMPPKIKTVSHKPDEPDDDVSAACGGVPPPPPDCSPIRRAIRRMRRGAGPSSESAAERRRAAYWVR